jgi:hypothetical protein
VRQAVSREGMIEAEWSRSYTGKFIPGDPINEMRNGPVRASLKSAKDAGLLLLRNVRRGTNFFERSVRLQSSNAERLQKLTAKRPSRAKPAAVSVTTNGVTSPSRISSRASANARPHTPASDKTENCGLTIDGF